MNYQDQFLKSCVNGGEQVAMYLVNGIKLQGIIVGYDAYSVMLKGSVVQMVFKHSIATIVPNKMIAWSKE